MDEMRGCDEYALVNLCEGYRSDGWGLQKLKPWGRPVRVSMQCLHYAVTLLDMLYIYSKSESSIGDWGKKSDEIENNVEVEK